MLKFFQDAGKFLFMSIFLLGCGACNNANNDRETSEPVVSLITWDTCGDDIGEHMCNIELKDQNGSNFNLYDHVGKPIVLDFSTMWCGYCQVAAQEVTSVQAAYADHDLLYITVLVEDSSGAAATVTDCANWASVFGIIDQPVLAGSREMLQSGENGGIEITGWPTFFFLTDELVVDTILRGYSAAAIDAGVQRIIPAQE